METGNPIQDALEGRGMPAPSAEAILRDHPTCALAAALALRQGAAAQARGTLRTAVVMHGTDRQAFADYAQIHGDFYRFYGTEAPESQKTTDSVIAAFIDTYGKSSPEEDALIERMIFNPVVPDYDLSQYDNGDTSPLPDPVGDQAPKVLDSDQALARQGQAPDTSLMESLAKIFVKQGRYSRAFEIISDLNLKYPEKSVYFADQLRFLQKLMVNQQYQRHSKQ